MLRIREVGHGGISRDKPSRDIPPNYVQEAHNVTCAGGTMNVSWGTELVATPPEAIKHLQAVNDARVIRSLLLISDTKAYSWQGGSIVDITTNPQVPVPAEETMTSDEIGGIAIWGWHGDAPHYWTPPNNGQEEYLPWDATDSWKVKNNVARVIRTYKNFIVAGHVDLNNVEHPRMIRWSESVTDTYTLPSWEVLPENDAGFVTLEDLPTGVIDMHVLGDALIIYGKTSAYMMQHVGGTFVMRFQHLDNLKGCAGTGLVMPFLNYHLVVSTEDIYVHNGGVPKSIVDEKLRQVIFASISEDTLKYSYLVKNDQLQEIMFCVPKGGDPFASYAFVFNYEKNTWTTRDLPPSYHAASTITPSCIGGSCPEWDTLADGLTWDSWSGTWAGSGGVNSDVVEVIMATTTPELRQCKCGAGEFTPPLIERIGLDISEDYNTQHTLQTVYPAIGLAPALVQVGAQDAQGGSVRWSKAQLFDPAVDKKLDVRGDNLTGSLWSYRIYSDVPSLFEFSGLELETSPAGKD